MPARRLESGGGDGKRRKEAAANQCCGDLFEITAVTVEVNLWDCLLHKTEGILLLQCGIVLIIFDFAC